MEITQNKPYPMFSDITREARERMARKDAGKGVIAIAILINSSVQRMIYIFFNSIYKAPAPAQLLLIKKKL